MQLSMGKDFHVRANMCENTCGCMGENMCENMGEILGEKSCVVGELWVRRTASKDATKAP